MLEFLYLIGLLIVFAFIVFTTYYFIFLRKSSISQKQNFNNSKYRYRKIDSYKYRAQRRKEGYLRDKDITAILM